MYHRYGSDNFSIRIPNRGGIDLTISQLSCGRSSYYLLQVFHDLSLQGAQWRGLIDWASAAIYAIDLQHRGEIFDIYLFFRGNFELTGSRGICQSELLIYIRKPDLITDAV